MRDLWISRDWSVMLLGEVFEPFDSSDYIYEVKFDGARAIIFASPKEVRIISRNNYDVTHLYPELQAIKKLVKHNTIFDGEIIAILNGLPSFSKLQERMHLKNKQKIDSQIIKNPVIFVCFDILYEEKNLIDLPIQKRKQMLDKYPDSEFFFKSKFIYDEGINMFKNIKEFNLEGIVAKKLGTTYEINTRSDSWLKIKNFKEEEFFIGGFTEIKGGYSVSLILGEYRNKNFYYVGKVTLGKKQRLFKQIKKEKVVKNSPFQDYNLDNIIYIKPKLKCKVKYIERTNSNHLRQPFIFLYHKH